MVKIGVTVYLKVNYQKKKLNPKKKWREREREPCSRSIREHYL